MAIIMKKNSSSDHCLVALTLLVAMTLIAPHEAKSVFAFVMPPAVTLMLRKGACSLDQAFRPTSIRYPFNNPCCTSPVHATRKQRKDGYNGGLLEGLRLRIRMSAWLKKTKLATKGRIKRKNVNQPVNDDVSMVELSSGHPYNADGSRNVTSEKHYKPKRWAVASNETDLSGVWKPIVTPKFREEYDEYLRQCGEGIIFRRTMLGAIGFLKEVIEQKDRGRELSITGTTPIGRWKRTLIASGYDRDVTDKLPSSIESTLFEPVYSTFQDPDGDKVNAESWWEDNGRVHKSWLRGKPRVLGAEFESTRYLLGDNNDVLVCESTFHPPPNYDSNRFQPASLEWRFRRE